MVASNIFDDFIVATTIAGSPIFNSESGKLVRIIALVLNATALLYRSTKE
jgi:hypothetical protein